MANNVSSIILGKHSMKCIETADSTEYRKKHLGMFEI
jgi:hypothetical protein